MIKCVYYHDRDVTSRLQCYIYTGFYQLAITMEGLMSTLTERCQSNCDIGI